MFKKIIIAVIDILIVILIISFIKSHWDAVLAFLHEHVVWDDIENWFLHLPETSDRWGKQIAEKVHEVLQAIGMEQTEAVQ